MSIIANKTNTLVHDAINKAIEEYVTTDAYQALLEKWELSAE